MILSIKEIIYSIVDAGIIIYFFARFNGLTEKFNFRMGMFTVIGGLLIQLMSPMVGVWLFLKIFSTVIIFIAIFKIYYKEIDYLKTLMYIGGSIFLLLLSEILIGTVIYSLTGISPQILFVDSMQRVLGAVLSKGVWCVLLNFLVLRFSKKYNIKKKQTYFINLVIVSNVMYLTFIIWMNTLIDISVSTQKHVIIAATIAVLFMSLGIIGLFNKILKQNEMEIEWELKEDMYNQQYKYLQEISEVNKKLRSQRHDFMNHLNTLKGLIYMEDDNKLKKYLNDLIGDVEDLNKTMYTSNPVLNGFLALKIKESQKLGLTFDIDITYPDKSHLRENDLVAVLGNLIDNSFEAAEKTADKYISLKTNYKNGKVIIALQNSKNTDVDLKNIGKNGFTTKKEKNKHGFGMYNVKNIVNRYGGMYDFLDKDKIFEARIMM